MVACVSGVLGLGMVQRVSAQQVPQQEPFGGSAPSVTAPRVPSPATPAIPAAPGSLSREAELEERVRQLEAVVNQLSSQMRQGVTTGGTAGGAAAVLPNIAPGATAPSNIPSPATAVLPSPTGGVGAPGQSLPPNPAPTNRFDQPATLQSLKGNFRFGPGFEIRTDDDEFILQFHNLTQFEYRGYQQDGHAP